MLRLIQQLPLFSILLLLGCAATGPPSGGPADKKGPELISIIPESVLNLEPDQKITFTFDELIDPISVPPSIQIDSDLKFNLKIRGRKIIVLPEKTWPDNGLVRIRLSRKVRDYQKNMMAKPVYVIFSTGLEIPDGIINGKVIKYNSKNLVELGLYEWPLSDSSQYIQKIEADATGNFKFTGIKNGQYSIGAVEGVLRDMNKQIKNKKYAILTYDFISITPEANEKMVEILLSKPVNKQNIVSVEMISQHSFNLIMDNKTEDYFMIDSLYKPGDSISVNLKKTNRLETYMLPEYSFILPEITDTLAPKLTKSFFEDKKFTLEFSEPVKLKANAITTKRDTVNIPVLFDQINEKTVIIPTLADTIRKIELWGTLIQDWNENLFADSVKILSIALYNEKEAEEEKMIGGNILGSIEYDGKEPIKIEAHNINNDLYYFTDVKNKQFKLSNLHPGLYELWGFEVLNTLNSDVYFSGLWQPYHRAARFATYTDTIEVRARWDVEGIKIDFE